MKRDEALARLAVLDQFEQQLTREQYEAACQIAGVPCHADTDRAVRTDGDFWWPEYEPDNVVERVLAQRRAYQLEAENKAARAARLDALVASRLATPETQAQFDPDGWPPGATAQLWEPCRCQRGKRRCGNEPVYEPAMRCAECWFRQ